LSGCAISALDLIGDQSTYAYAYGGALMGDVVYVRTSRQLTKIELDTFSDMTGAPLHWPVYSSATEGGP
jgi:hypothetical protein